MHLAALPCKPNRPAANLSFGIHEKFPDCSYESGRKKKKTFLGSSCSFICFRRKYCHVLLHFTGYLARSIQYTYTFRT